ncbi:class I SAM-dependent methyltransferase [Saccharomonospora sp.]|uniref:class I SAM-dependent methyltransferase n=1 Tax=Saccharomonospora sp. TaxID=33913 RepID=UPI002605F28F|nr:class I SAM-dependent methyltransferase [Saccharomonospora sp.]
MGGTEYAPELASMYDALYETRGRDYATEVAMVLAEAAEAAGREPGSVLDVACGTGEHLRHFAERVSEAEGLELSSAMLDIAASRLPGVPLHKADMRKFALGRRFDLVTCLFSSIGYAADEAELRATIEHFARHLTEGGVVIVEPWYFPETFLPGYVAGDVVRDGRRTIARMSHSVEDAGRTRMRVHFLLGDPDGGIRHIETEHVITLFTREQYETAFESAGLRVNYRPGGPSGRGLFVGIG